MDRTNFQNGRILLVDDNLNGLVARRSVLEELGYEITATTDPLEALTLFANHRFDLLITDYKMPKLDGLELIRTIRQSNSDVPIILISGFAETLGLTEASTGSDAVVQKSSNEIQHLVHSVARLLKKKTPKKPAASVSRSAAAKVKAKGVS
jgi:CheY-like chemotaxis protein